MYLIGIAGGSGSGKTTFANKVRDKVQTEISTIHLDSYYLPSPPRSLLSDKGRPNFDHPEAFDWELLHQHLKELKLGHDIDCPTYEFKTSSRSSETRIIKSHSIIILEGIFALFHHEIRSLFDIRVFLHVDADIRFTRRLHRDVQERGRSLESVIEQYYDTVRPMHNKYLEPQKQYADFIVGEESDIAADILAAKINELASSFYAFPDSSVNLFRQELSAKN